MRFPLMLLAFPAGFVCISMCILCGFYLFCSRAVCIFLCFLCVSCVCVFCVCVGVVVFSVCLLRIIVCFLCVSCVFSCVCVCACVCVCVRARFRVRPTGAHIFVNNARHRIFEITAMKLLLK